ncbi:porin [Robbsia sp. KACC 23696]|uniref:porin n=1 Tax=Robbsia sp. KACC 23696 TaxID=3149231 RepID=UPI00325B26E1
MKKTLIAVAALACAAGVQAQSNVTLYGVLDHSVGGTSNVIGQNGNAGRQFALYPAGGLEGSRWGLRGSEDLGAGLSAFFNVESGLNLGNGRFTEDGTLFNRRALVGLRSQQFGAISLGRQSDFVVDFVAPFSQVARYARTIGGARFDMNNFDYSSQMQNSIKYVSPSFSGFHFGAAVSLAGIPGRNRDNILWSAGAGYDNGPFKFGLAYTDSKNASFNPFLTNLGRPNSGAPTQFQQISGLSDVQTRYRVGAAGGAYAFGPATIAAAYSYVRNDVNAPGASIDLKAHIAEISGTYQLTSAVGLGLGYTYTRGNAGATTATQSGRGKFQFHQITAGANYALSRRTEVYATIAAQRSGKDNVIGTGINGVGASNKDTQITGRVGLRHAF